MYTLLILLIHQGLINLELKLSDPINLSKTQQPIVQRTAGNIYVAGNTDLFVLNRRGEQIHRNNLKYTLNKNLEQQAGKNWYISNFTVLPEPKLICISLVADGECRMVFTDLKASEIKGYGIDPTFSDPTQAGFRQLFYCPDGTMIANVSKREAAYDKQSLILREVDIYPAGSDYRVEYIGHIESRFFEKDSWLYIDSKVVLNQLSDGRIVLAYRNALRMNFYHRDEEGFFEKKGYVSLSLPGFISANGETKVGQEAENEPSKIVALASADGGYRVAYFLHSKQADLRIARVDNWGKVREVENYAEKRFVAFDPEGVWLYYTKGEKHFLTLE